MLAALYMDTEYPIDAYFPSAFIIKYNLWVAPRDGFFLGQAASVKGIGCS